MPGDEKARKHQEIATHLASEYPDKTPEEIDRMAWAIMTNQDKRTSKGMKRGK